MPTPVPDLQILVFDKQQKVCAEVFTGAVELGRQRDGREVVYSSCRDGDKARLVIARLDEDTVSREHALIDSLPNGRIKLTNRSAKISIRLSDGGELKAGASCELSLPAIVALGRKTVRIQSLLEPKREETPAQWPYDDQPPPVITLTPADILKAFGTPTSGDCMTDAEIKQAFQEGRVLVIHDSLLLPCEDGAKFFGPIVGHAPGPGAQYAHQKYARLAVFCSPLPSGLSVKGQSSSWALEPDWQGFEAILDVHTPARQQKRQAEEQRKQGQVALDAQTPMSSTVGLQICERTGNDRAWQPVFFIALRGRTELGRQESTTEALYSCAWCEAEKHWRVVIAHGTEQTIGRHHALVELLPDGRVKFTNTRAVYESV